MSRGSLWCYGISPFVINFPEMPIHRLESPSIPSPRKMALILIRIHIQVVLLFQIKTNKLFYLFKPFQNGVWVAAAVTFAVSTLCFCSLGYLGNKIRNIYTKEHVFSSTSTVWYIAQLWLFQSKKNRLLLLHY